jgi:putative ABC transport system permease protein
VRVSGVRVSPFLLSKIFRMQPVVGRDFAADDDVPGRNFVALISHGLWQRNYAGSASVVGEPITLDGAPYTIIGVLPREITYPNNQVDIWIPYVPAPAEINRGMSTIRPIGRIKPGSSLEQVAQEINLINKRIEASNTTFHQDWYIRVLPMQELIVGDMRPAVLVLLGAVAFVLLIACANLANLLLARAAAREAEFAVRQALGAGRGRLARQLLTESICLSLTGALLGAMLTAWLLPLGARAVSNFVPRADDIRLDGTVLLATLLVSIAAGALFGVLPAWHSARGSLADTLRSGRRSSAVKGFAFRALIVSQIAIALVLLIGSGLMLRSFLRVNSLSPGFKPEGLLGSQLDLPSGKYPTPQQHADFFQRVVDDVRTVPGVSAASAVSRIPFQTGGASTTYYIEGKIDSGATQWPWADTRLVAPDYFSTMQIPVLRGREFNRQDNGENPKVILINQEMAKRYWPNEDAVGKRIRIFPEVNEFREVAGVVGDVKIASMEAEIGPTIYLPMAQSPFPNATRSGFILMRSDQEASALYRVLQERLARMDSAQAAGSIKVLSQSVSDSVGQRRLSTVLVSAFAGFAALMAMLGIYGVMSFFVTQRTREIGTRVALGAQSGDILGMVLRDGLTMAVIGVVLGIGGALALTRYVAKVLYGVPATDPITYTVIAVTMIAIAALACLIPARSAMRVDPIIALRAE